MYIMALFAVTEDMATSIYLHLWKICMIAGFNISSQNIVTIFVALYNPKEDTKSTPQSI